MPNLKKRVAILHYAAPPTIGGVESTIGSHAQLFAAHGYPVKIIAGRGEPFDSRIPIELIPTLDSRHSFVANVNRKLTAGIVNSDFLGLSAAIRRALVPVLVDVDVCIVHNALSLHKNLALTNALREIARTTRPRLIAWCHDFAWQDPVYANELHAGRPWDLLRQPWERTQYVVVSNARRNELQTLWRNPAAEIAVIPPGIDPFDFLGVGATTARVAHQFQLLAAAPLLLLPARVTRRKNIGLAIEIVAALRAHNLAPKLIVMGPLGPHNPTNAIYLEELKTLRRARGIDDAVIFLQEEMPVDDAMRRDLYALADALLFPSEREGFGIPILEAGLARLPIFCADIPPFRESARAFAHYFALAESPRAIAAQIAHTLEHDAQYQLKQRVIREYAWEQIFVNQIEPLVSNTEMR